MNSPEGTSYMSEQNDCAVVKLTPSEISRVHSEIVSFIWGIADDCLRDVYVRGKYRDVILPMTVIRRLDAVLVDSKPTVLALKKKLDAAGIDDQWPALCRAANQAFCNSSPFILKDLTSRTHQQTLKADFEAYLDGFSPNVQEILEKFKFRSQIDTMVDADILGSVIDKFVSPDINLSPNPVYYDDAKTRVKLPGLDNHGMGTIFEELIRRFNEENNEEAGEHWTPRDVVELMADLVFMPVADQIKDATYSCYDGACGTGGMLTVAQDRLLQLAAQRDKHVSIHLFGQEINSETYAICKADMLLKGDGEEADHISYGSTLSLDQNATRQFDFMLSNPPYGKSWKTDAEKMGGKKEILDSRFNAYLANGEQLRMLPDLSDGQLLFLLNNVAKMKDLDDSPMGSRIVEVHNGSSIFTGEAGSGSSNARRYLIENDYVEAIIALPENMFYNTPLATYIWVLSNNKDARRRGKIQLIDATNLKAPLAKNLGMKNCELSQDIRDKIVHTFLEMETSDISKIFNNQDFGYWQVTIQRPLRLRILPDHQPSESLFKKGKDADKVRCGIQQALASDAPLDDWDAFAKATGLNKTLLKRIRPYITSIDSAAKPVADEFDSNFTDTERVPLGYPGGIGAYIKQEVLPYVPDAVIDPTKTQIGYEISFTEHFGKPIQLPSIREFLKSLSVLERQTDGMLEDLYELINMASSYAATHDSGISWIGDIPQSWDSVKIKRLFSEDNERNDDGQAELLSFSRKKGLVPFSELSEKEPSASDLTKYRLVKPGQLLENRMQAWSGMFICVDRDGCVSPDYSVFNPSSSGVNVKYYEYMFRSPLQVEQFANASRGVGSGFNRLYTPAFGAIDTIHPPIQEQNSAVDYLDKVCGLIDSAINKLDVKSHLLEDLRTSLVEDVVTGKLDVSDINLDAAGNGTNNDSTADDGDLED